MKKFSFIFLIIIIFLNNLVFTQDIKELEKCVGNCREVIAWFKKYGLYDSFVNAIHQGGKQYAIRVCKQIFPDAVCQKMIEILMKCV